MIKTTKIKLSVLLLIAGIALMPLMASAATLSLSPGTISVTRGQNVTMTVTVNPQGSTIYSTKVELQYPAELLEFISFNFGGGWIHASPDDFNSGGILRRTAGYPNPGLSSQAIFGTVTFLAKANGAGVVSITANSVAYNGSLQNVLTGVPVSASVAISAPTATPVSTPLTGTVTAPTPTTPETPTTPTAPAEEPTEEGAVLGEQAPVTQEPTAAPQPIERSLLAAVGSVVSLGTNSIVIGLLVVVVVLALAGYTIYSVIQRARRKNLGKPQL